MSIGDVKTGQVLPPPRGTAIYTTAGEGPILAVRYEGMRLVEVLPFESLDEAGAAVAKMSSVVTKRRYGTTNRNR